MDPAQDVPRIHGPYYESGNASGPDNLNSGSKSTSLYPEGTLQTANGDTSKAIAEAQQGKYTEITHDPVLAKLNIFDPDVDPSTPYFDFNKWSRMLASLRRELSLPTPPRSGFVFKHLAVRGKGPSFGQKDTVSTWLASPLNFKSWFQSARPKIILQGLDGVIQKGELLLVLGRPGSGCTTFLKTITGEIHGLELDPVSVLNYNGVLQNIMAEQFKGELVYNQEVDEHLPYLTVGQTLEFAAAMRTPRTRLPKVTRSDRMKHAVEVVLKIFGLSHTRNTIVGNDYVRGVSGGERKRVSIAETALSGAAICAWDGSTRGLDAKSSLSFVRHLRTLSDVTQSTNAVAIYQSSQAIIDLFDKVLVLYEGRQIFFGTPDLASKYFERMGWHRPARQTTGDFLTIVTNPAQRVPREGFDSIVPRTPEEFQLYWYASQEYASLEAEVAQYQTDFFSEGETTRREFQLARNRIKAKGMLEKATETVSFPMQTAFCARRAYQQLWNDRASTFTALVGEIFIALVVGSIFYGTPNTSDALFSYGSVLFFSVLLNVLMSMTDIYSLFKVRPVVRKQASYAFYRPSADALAGVLVDIPVKFVNAVCFNIILYFLSGLAMTAAQFFTFFIFVFATTLSMSMVFRTIAAVAASISQAMAISGILVLALVTYTGFVLPSPYMHPWFRWISYINPLSYAFEALLVNQAHGATYTCSNLVPPYEGLTGETFICPVPGAVVGQTYVSGDAWFETNYHYSYTHLWRNFGIILAFFVFFFLAYIIATDLVTSVSYSKNNLVFLRGHVPSSWAHGDAKLKRRADAEEPSVISSTSFGEYRPESPSTRAIGHRFSWRNLTLDVEIKGQPRRLLDNVSGWVQPGTLTALMGVSGAGKTTLLNALAQTSECGIIHGEVYVDGKPLPPWFKNDIGYVQQGDIHLETTTVREAIMFSATLRQPQQASASENIAFVEQIIRTLGMGDFADAIVGQPGEGLNLEQRKRLSIGVELAGKPSLLIFLDEPTSGLDSQSSEAILSLLVTLAASGLGILCTIHQPSAMLFQRFDRLLLMAAGGKVAYFGDIGENSEKVVGYFGERGPRTCADTENPAEYLLEMIGNTENKYDWPGLWNRSEEAKSVSDELKHMVQIPSETPIEGRCELIQTRGNDTCLPPLSVQMMSICLRVFQQYWRSPAYIASKLALGLFSALFIGFSFFEPGKSILDVQNSVFAVLLVCATFSTLVQQIMPNFIIHRAVYEGREQHSNMYSWAVLITANALAEVPYHIIMGIVTFAIFNYTVFGIRSSEDQGLILLFFIYFYILAGTFAHMLIAPLPDATTAGRVTTILFSMMILFAGVFQTPTALPGFWIFMYRVSPMTYLIGGIAVAGLSGNAIVCSQSELAVFQPPKGETCGVYLQPFLEQGATGKLLNPTSTANCSYCPSRMSDQVLARLGMYYEDRWMDWGIGFAYIAFNIICAFGFYFVFRRLNLHIHKFW